VSTTVKENFLRDFFRILVWYPLRWIILLLPVHAGLLVMRSMGDLHYYCSRSRKKILKNNFIRLHLKKHCPDGVTKEHFRNYYIDRLMIFIFPKLDASKVKNLLEIEGIENLKRSLKAGKGLILVHAHFGPVHLPLVALARMGYPIKQIGNPSDEGLSWIGRKVSFRLRLYYEDKIPAEIIKPDTFLRSLFRWLQQNGIVMVTGDGTGTDRKIGRYEDFLFFGQNMAFPLGPYLLSEKTEAAILPMFIVPGLKKRYRMVIEQPLCSELSGKMKMMDLAGKFIQHLERHVTRYPGYMHFLDRFHPGGLIKTTAPPNSEILQ
jgi:phosphatidylinositol dimannoside acyltransferase